MTSKEREELLVRIDERQKVMLDIMGQIQETSKQDHANHDERLQKIEHWRSRLAGAWLVLTVMAGVIGAVASLIATHIINM